MFRQVAFLFAVIVTGCGARVESTPLGDSGTETLAETSPGDTAIETSSSDSPSKGVILLTSLKEVCDKVPGLTGESILGALKPEYKALFTNKRDGSTSAMTLKPVFGKGEIRCYPSFDPGTGGAPVMPAYLELVIALDFSTADGALAESTSKATLTKRFGPNIEVATSFGSKELKGTFKPIEMPGYDLIDFQLGGTFASDGSTSGTLAQFGSKSGPGVSPHTTLAAGTWK